MKRTRFLVKPVMFCAFALLAGLSIPLLAADDLPLPPTPPQDQGLPYTRSSRARALEQIPHCLAVFPGSRYAYVNGFEVRLDDKNWHDEALAQNGTIFVPESAASLLSMTDVHPDAPPSYLADRWIYSPPRPAVQLPAGVPTIEVDGRTYVDLIAAAESMHLKAFQHPRGLVFIGAAPPTLDGLTPPLVDSIVTLFDTPEKLADPDIATQYIPTLKRQGKWTDHVKVTPEQLKILNGPETKWPTAPQSSYDFTGFNFKLLGSKVPPPGVYPRVLFSPEDVPMLAERLKKSAAGQMSLIEMKYLFEKSWWNPKTSDGQIFQKLASGDVAGLEFDSPPGTPPNAYSGLFKGQKPGIFNTHVQYNPECLTTMALYCLLTNDDAHGRQAAAAIASYYKLREPLLDETNQISDSEFGGVYVRPNGESIKMEGNGAATHWRTVSGLVAHMNIGLALDFGGKWMTPEEKDTMRRFIVKATYGKRPYGQDGSIRFRDVNWVAWDLPPFLALAAIEGLEGFDREAYESDCATVRAYCDWAIDENGVIYESNGKTPGALQFQTLSMITLARRGENLFGHPHWRKLLEGQIEMTSPNGRVTVNSGTQYVPYSRQYLSPQLVDEYKAFFPEERNADYLLGRAKMFLDMNMDTEAMRQWSLFNFSPDEYREKVASVPRLRLPSPTYPGFVHGMLYDTDIQPTTRADLNLPLDFNDPVHGVFSSYSDQTPNATWINMMVRPDHYIGAGHHHSDAGMFHFSGLGVDWFTQTQFSGNYEGKYYNLVQVDGHSEPEALPGGNAYNAAATYLGAESNSDGAFGRADLTSSYSYRWQTQPGQVWPPNSSSLGWEMDPSPRLLEMFAGTAHYKMRFWWANYTYSNYIATSRAPWNPMQYVYRNVGLVRGPHPYGVVIDDLKKDDQTHLYQWVAMLNGGVWQAKMDGLSAGQAVLGFRDLDPKANGKINPNEPPIVPQPGDPLLLVCVVGAATEQAQSRPLIQVTAEMGPVDKKGNPEPYGRITINHSGSDAHFKVLLIPFRAGEALPSLSGDADATKASLAWADQTDELSFSRNANAPSSISVNRAGKTILASR
jgi:hypothetical protein